MTDEPVVQKKYSIRKPTDSPVRVDEVTVNASMNIPFTQDFDVKDMMKFHEDSEVLTKKKSKEDKVDKKSDVIGLVYALLPQSKEWRKFYMKKRIPFLYFYKNVGDNDYIAAYCLYRSHVQITHD